MCEQKETFKLKGARDGVFCILKSSDSFFCYHVFSKRKERKKAWKKIIIKNPLYVILLSSNTGMHISESGKGLKAKSELQMQLLRMDASLPMGMMERCTAADPKIRLLNDVGN